VTIIDVTLLMVFILLVLLAGLLSGAETGIYQLSRLRLRLGIEQKKFSYIILGRTLRDGTGLLISLLLGTNLAYYLATSSIIYLLLLNKQCEGRVELITTIIATPIFLVFSELIPKNLFYYRADQIMPAVSPLVYIFDRLCRITGLTYLLKLLSRLTSGFRRPAVIQKGSVLAATIGFETILDETKEEGILSTTQSEMMRRLGHTSHLTISSSMTGFAKTALLDVKSTKEDLINVCRQYPYTRYPVYDGWRSNIIGYVNIYQSLSCKNDFSQLYDFLKPIHKMPANTVVLDAIESMQARAGDIILVTQTAGSDKPVGIVTMKDLVEELLGELAEW